MGRVVVFGAFVGELHCGADVQQPSDQIDGVVDVVDGIGERRGNDVRTT